MMLKYDVEYCYMLLDALSAEVSVHFRATQQRQFQKTTRQSYTTDGFWDFQGKGEVL